MFVRVCVAALVCAAVACAQAQPQTVTAVQETQSPGYFSSLMENMNALSDTDWQGMVRRFVDTVVQYFVASNTREGETSRSFGGEMAVHFIEGVLGQVGSWLPATQVEPDHFLSRNLVEPIISWLGSLLPVYYINDDTDSLTQASLRFDAKEMIHDTATSSMNSFISWIGYMLPRSGWGTARMAADPTWIDLLLPGAFINKKTSETFQDVAAEREGISVVGGEASLSTNLRGTLGTNPYLPDQTLMVSWQYVFFMIGYCLFATITGILAIVLLPDPKTLSIIRDEGSNGNEDDSDAAAQSLAAAYDSYEDQEYDEAAYDTRDPSSYASYKESKEKSPSLMKEYINTYDKYRKRFENDYQSLDAGSKKPSRPDSYTVYRDPTAV